MSCNLKKSSGNASKGSAAHEPDRAKSEAQTMFLSKSDGSAEQDNENEGQSKPFENDRIRESERAFLPSALEVTETPPNPVARILGGMIALFTFLAISWSVLGKVDIVAIAVGQTAPVGGVKIVQPKEAGIVRKINVSDGQHVEKGDILLDLDPTEVLSDKGQLLAELQQYGSDIERLREILSFIDSSDVYEAEQPKWTQEGALDTENYRIRAEIMGYQSQVNAMRAEIARTISEGEAIVAESRKLEILLPLLIEQEVELKELFDKGLTPKQRYLEIKTQRIEAVQDSVVQTHRLEEMGATRRALESELVKYKSDMRSDLIGKLVDAEKNLKQNELALQKIAAQEKLNTLRAPVGGTVQQLQTNTIGGVVSPAETLMHIVPDNSPIEVRAKILNKDRGFVREGMNTEVKFDAFPFTKYGVVIGTVRHISKDAVEDEQLGLVYDARIKIDQSSIAVGDEAVNLGPGMSVQAEIMTGKRRVIEYVLSPVLRYQDEALRER